MRALVIIALLGGTANAEPSDGYCDSVEGVAEATSAVQFAPELIAQFGYVEQPPSTVAPSQTSTLRLIAGVNYRLTGIYEGYATRDHAHADCRRHNALAQIRGESMARALAARSRVLDGALDEADKILTQSDADMEAHRMSAQEATALRLRIEELRELAADAHRQMSALPSPTDHPLGNAMAAYHDADAQMEVDEAKLRRAAGIDVEVRAGVDEFLDSTIANPTPYFAVISVGFNFGVLFQGDGNTRAAAGRKRLLESGHEPLGVEATLGRIRAMIEVEAKRSEQTAALVAELERQIDALTKISGEDSKRYRETVWFDFIKAKAEHAYLKAHLASLHEVLGGNE